MPTSEQEAKTIATIINDYCLPEDACELSQRLDTEVGSNTHNESLKSSLKMLRGLLEQQAQSTKVVVIAQDSPMYKFLLFSLYALIVIHIFIVVVNVLTLFLLPLVADWHLIVPIMSLLVMLNFSRNIDCPLTRLENHLRIRLGKKRIGGFLGHYFIKPWRRFKKQLSLAQGHGDV